MSTSSRDEKLMLLRDEFGLEGYAVYWLMLEAIAEGLTSESIPKLTFSPKNWRKVTEISPQKFKKFLNFCEKTKLFIVVLEEKLITVECPNMLKYRDEYTKKNNVSDT